MSGTAVWNRATCPHMSGHAKLRSDNRRVCIATLCGLHTHLFENLCSHVVTAVKDDAELPTSLHFFEKGSGVLRVNRELTDL